MVQVDLYADDFPTHGSRAGYDAGCRGKASCPNYHEDGLPTCVEANTRYHSDYGYRIDVNAGLTVAQIAAKDQMPPTGIAAALAEARARDEKNKAAAPTTAKPSITPQQPPVPKPTPPAAPQTPSTPAEAPIEHDSSSLDQPEEAAGVDGTPDDLLPTSVVLTMLGLNRQALHRLVNSGRLPAIRAVKGAHAKYLRRDVDAYLANKDHFAPEPQPEAPQKEVLDHIESAPRTPDAAADGRGDVAGPPTEPTVSQQIADAFEVPIEQLGTPPHSPAHASADYDLALGQLATSRALLAAANESLAAELTAHEATTTALAEEQQAHASTKRLLATTQSALESTENALEVSKNALDELQRDHIDLTEIYRTLKVDVEQREVTDELRTGGATSGLETIVRPDRSPEDVALQIDPTQAGGARLTFTMPAGAREALQVRVAVASHPGPGLGDLTISVG